MHDQAKELISRNVFSWFYNQGQDGKSNKHDIDRCVHHIIEDLVMYELLKDDGEDFGLI